MGSKVGTCSLGSRAWSLLALLIAGCSEPHHIAVGSWRGEVARVVVYPDQVATVNNFRCAWVPADYWSVRIEMTESQAGGSLLPLASELRVLEGSDGMRATLGLPWGLAQLVREGSGPPPDSDQRLGD